MRIAGLQKMTLLDYPGKVACTVFLQGCNFRCPFCHNRDLLDHDGPYSVDEEEFWAFLRKRQGLLDGVCVTGGEPTVQKSLPDFLKKIKALGYSVKLDTNGFRPDVLKQVVSAGLVDYVAMDIKNSPARYAETAGLPHLDLTCIEKSISFLTSNKVDYEFRTTVVEEFHDEQAFVEIAQWLQKVSENTPKAYFIQQFTQRDSVLQEGLSTPEAEKLARFLDIAAPFVHRAEIRGVEL